jgi:hypothetical protein
MSSVLTTSVARSADGEVVAAATSFSVSPHLQLTRTNFPGSVAFAVYGGLPQGATATFTPNPATGNSSTLQVVTTDTTTDGSYTLYLVGSGKDPSGTTRYAYASLGAGVAYAYWPATGFGTGSATNADMQTVTVAALVAGDSPVASLAPGGTADVVLRLHNPNPYPVQVYSVAANGSVTPDSGHAAGCTTTGVTFTAPASPVGDTIPADADHLVRLPSAAGMTTASSAGCQGATFQIPVTVTVRR